MNLKENLDFNYDINHKVYGVVDADEAHELFYEGTISKLFQPSFPKTIGMFELMIYDLEKAKEFNQFDKIIEIIADLSCEYDSRFTNLDKLVNDHDLDFQNKDRIIFLKNCVIHPDWRGKGVLDELLKSIYLTHYTRNSMLIVNTSPIQNMRDELEFFMTDYSIDVNDGLGNNSNIMLGKYFELDKLPEEDEGHDYKLYARMLKLNLKQFEDTNFFYQNSKKEYLKLFNK